MSENRKSRYEIRTSREEVKAWRRAAKRDVMPLSVWVRRTLTRAAAAENRRDVENALEEASEAAL